MDFSALTNNSWDKDDELDPEDGSPIYTLPPDTILDGPTIMSAERWHHRKADWDPIREITKGGSVKVAVLDTGADTDHPLLPKIADAKSFIRGESIEDRNSHGTHVSGTILGRSNEFSCAPEATLLIGKVLSNRGSGSSSGIASGIRWAVDAGADVINMSLGGGSKYQPTIDAINYAFSKGCIVCAAAGNSGFNGRNNTIGWPARSGRSICVGATRSDGRYADFSSGGVQVDVAAPGQQITSCMPGGGLGNMSGTSMATPMIAGYFALITDVMRGQGYARWTAVEAVKEFIKINATDKGDVGEDDRYGSGILLMHKILPKILNKLIMT